jgi:ParB family chromosome partitioning protein
MAESEKILQLSPDQLRELPGFNVRLADDPDNVQHIAELAESIFHVGVLEPLTAYATKREGTDESGPSGEPVYVITNGHCRLEAVKQAIARGAPIKTIPVRLENKRASEADHTFSMIARNSGKSLSQLELGVACKRMVAFGWSEQSLADKSGYSLQHVRNCLALASAPEAVKKLVETGQVSATLATQAIAAEGGEKASAILTEAVAEAEKEAAAKPAKKGKEKAEKSAPVKATLKHVSKVKGQSAPTKLAKKTKQPEPSTMMSDERLAASVRSCGKLENALALFDTFAKRRLGVFELLLAGTSAGNGKPPELETLKLIFARVAFDAPDADGIVTLVMADKDWQDARKLLGIAADNDEFAEEHGVKPAKEHEFQAP